MSYKIVVDSCCELPENLKNDSRFERVPLTLIVGDKYEKEDDETFDQKEFLEIVAASEECAKSACPSPEKYMNAYKTDAEHVYVVTLTSRLSGSYNSALVAKELYHETYGEKDIYVVDSKSASGAETQLVLKLIEWEEEGISFEEITEKIEEYVKTMRTFFVLENLDTLRKNGRLTGVKSVMASTLNIKPIMTAEDGTIVQLSQSIGMKKALAKMVDTAINEVSDTESKSLIITHCNNKKAAESVKKQLEEKATFKQTIVMDMGGLSSLYANDGGIIISI